ncbi:MAG TPA: Tol-Pal system beta propeller repeat protein TolB [Alphaproteobacteria bacterium]|nr:Tol-Pal system beta propeller repeat protein TolB [Alphaproteobacteria bacterium]
MIKKFAFTCLALLSLTLGAAAELRINVTEGTFKPVPIAITPFDGSGDPELARVGQDITDVIMNDLESCGLFKIVDPQAHIQSAQDVMTAPRFADWKILNAEALVGGLLKRNGSNFQVDFRLFDVFTESQLTGLSLGSESANWRRVAHKIADEIYERMTGDKGYFDTRVVYIAESGPEMERKYRLAIMDYDGANHQFISSGNTRVLTPRFSPDRTKIAYVDFGRDDKSPALHIHDLETGQSESLSSVEGQRMSPRFSPKGDHLILASAKGGATTLYKMDLASKRMDKLTSSSASIDVSPCYSPDGSKICFISDRGGKNHIYVRDATGGEATRISFSQGIYDNPVWSPRGDLIVFTRLNRGTFYIGVISPDGSGERMLDSGYLLEGPTWSPNGREIMYTCQPSRGSKVGLCSVDIVGFNKRKVPIPGEGSYPTW